MFRKVMSQIAASEGSDRLFSSTAPASYRRKKTLEERVDQVNQECKSLQQRTSYLKTKVSALNKEVVPKEDEERASKLNALQKMMKYVGRGDCNEETLVRFGLLPISKK